MGFEKMYKFRDFKTNNVILGMNGTGKSNLFKDIIYDFSNTYDKQLFIIDCYGEYRHLCKDIEIENYNLESIRTSINPFDLKIGEFDDNMLFRKIDFLFNFFESILNRSLTSWERRLLDKELIELYRPYIKYLKDNDLTIDRNICPILEDFLEQIKFNEDLEEIKLALELFSKGKFKHIFNNKTNIEDNFIVNFDISRLDRNLQEIVYLNCLEYIYQKSGENLDKSYRTFVFVEENFFFLKKFIFEYFKNFLIRMRTMGGTIFLNYSFVQDLVENDEGKCILSLLNKFYLFRMNILDAGFLKKMGVIDDKVFNEVQKLGVGEKIEI